MLTVAWYAGTEFIDPQYSTFEWPTPGSAVSSTAVIYNPAAGDYYFATPLRQADWIDCYGNFPTSKPFPRYVSVQAKYTPMPPTMATQPQSRTDVQGTAASFAVVAHGDSLHYNWQKRPTGGGSITTISRATSPNFVIASVSASDAADYRAVVYNSGGSVTSAWATLTVIVPPVITVQPAPKAVMPGNSATFSVTATGGSPLGYQWYHRDLTGTARLLAGATASTLTVGNVAYPGNAGTYYVLVMNPANPVGVQSRDAALTVGPGAVSLLPPGPSVNEGQPITLAATGTGTAPLIYNWLHNGVPRQSGPSFTISSAMETDDGAWELDVTNQAGKVSRPFTLTVIPPPTPPSFVTLPAAQAVTEGRPLSLKSWAVGTRPLSYQWFTNGVIVAGATDATVSIAATGPEDAGQWSVLVTNSLGQTSSPPVTVTVLTGPTISQQPQSQQVAPSNSATLSVVAVGRQPLTYQWYKNGQPIADTESELSITNASGADTGFYSVAVTNGLGDGLVSSVARLSVQAGAIPLGSVLWSVPLTNNTGANGGSSTVLLSDHGDLVIASGGSVRAISSDGQTRWFRTTTTAGPQIMAAPNGVTILDDEGTVYALDSNGGALWTNALVIPDEFDQAGFPVAWLATHRLLGMAGTNSILETYKFEKFINQNLYFFLNRVARIATRDGSAEYVEGSEPSYSDLDFPTAVRSWGRTDGSLAVLEQSLFSQYVPDLVDMGTNWSRQWEVSFIAENGGFGYYPSEDQIVLPGGVTFGGSAGQRFVGANTVVFGGVWAWYAFSPQGSLLSFKTQPPQGIPRHTIVCEGNSVSHTTFYFDTVAPDLATVTTNGETALLYSFYPFRDTNQAFFADNMLVAGDGTTYCSGTVSTLHGIYLTNGTGCLLAVGADGQLSWQFNPPEPAQTFGGDNDDLNQITIGPDGTVYFLTVSNLYALKGSAPIEDSTWPKYAGNVRGTWQAQQLPTFTQTISPQELPRGSNLLFSITAQGPVPLLYQWLKNGRLISGATNSSFALSNLLGFDSGGYQVRVSNPTGDRLSQSAHLKVSLDLASFTNGPSTLDAAFTNAPPSANVSRDIWQFFYGINETNRNGNYSRMDAFSASGTNYFAPGLATWFSSGDAYQAVGRNMTALTVSPFNGYLPSRDIFMHPRGDDPGKCVGVGFQAEVAGVYSISGQVGLLSPIWDELGTRWYLDVGSINVASGYLTNGAPACDCGFTNSAFAASVFLSRGDYLYFIAGSDGSGVVDQHVVDVQLNVQLLQPDTSSEPGVLQSPLDLAVVQGQNASFGASIDGKPDPLFKWQLSTNNGATWQDLVEGVDGIGTDTTNLQLFGVTLDMSGQMYRLEALNAAGSVDSAPATLTVTSGYSPPTVVTQPQGLTLLSGNMAILSAGAAGAGPFSYQWWKDGQLLAGQTHATLTLGAAGTSDSGSYYVVVSNDAGSVTGEVATISVNQSPTPPVLALATSTDGMKVTLGGTAAGTQWQVRRTQTLPGAWQPISLVTLDDNGTGSILDTNPPPDAAYYQADLYLSATTPQIEIQPQSWTFPEGSQASLSVSAVGAAPLIYQWWKDGRVLTGVTTGTLIIPGVTSNSIGSYQIVITNNYGAVTSQVAVLSVGPPVNYVVVTDIVATASSELTSYGRYACNAVNGVYIDFNPWESVGAGNQSFVPGNGDPAPYIVFDLRSTYNLANFSIWNGHEHDPAVKQILVEYSLDGQSYQSFGLIDLNLATGTTNASDVIDLTGVQARYVRFDILENYSPQSFPVVGQPTNYSLVMIDEVQFIGQFVAPGLPRITLQPVGGTTNLAGATATLSAAADGPGPLGYQWFRDGGPLTNATNHILTVGPLGTADAGTYTLVVSNAAGEIVSAPAGWAVSTNVTILSGPVPGLLAYFPFNANALDATGNGHDGQLQGAIFSADRFGIYGAALGADIGKYVSVPGINPDDYGQGFSFGGWVQVGSGGPLNNQFLCWNINDSPSAPATTFITVGVGKLYFRASYNGTDATDHYGLPEPFVQDQWYHVFVTHGPAVDRLYLEGQLAGEWPTLPPHGNPSTLHIGLDCPESIDDVAVFGRELSTNEVSALYSGGIVALQPLVLRGQTAGMGSFRFQAVGRPNTSWTLQRATSVLGPWTNLENFTIGLDGTAVFQDTNAPASFMFYRARTQ